MHPVVRRAEHRLLHRDEPDVQVEERCQPGDVHPDGVAQQRDGGEEQREGGVLRVARDLEHALRRCETRLPPQLSSAQDLLVQGKQSKLCKQSALCFGCTQQLSMEPGQDRNAPRPVAPWLCLRSSNSAWMYM